MNDQDIRWKQRFANFEKAFLRLKDAIALSQARGLSDLEEQGLIQGFEYTFELAWKTIKDYLAHMQVADAKFPREVIKQGFQYDLIDDGDVWIDMLEKRNLMAHAYDEAAAQTAHELIKKQYFEQLEKMYHLFGQK